MYHNAAPNNCKIYMGVLGKCKAEKRVEIFDDCIITAYTVLAVTTERRVEHGGGATGLSRYGAVYFKNDVSYVGYVYFFQPCIHSFIVYS